MQTFKFVVCNLIRILDLVFTSIEFMKCCTGSEDHDDGYDKTVKTNSLSENEDKDHTNEDSISLGVGSDTSVSSNTNSQSSSKGRKTAAESSSEVFVAIFFFNGVTSNLSGSNDCNNNTIDTQDT